MNPRRQLLSALFLGAMTFSLVGCNSGSSSITSPNDTAPPQAPGNLHARFDAPTHRDWLAWDPSASTGVSSYEVQYSETPSGIGTVLGVVPSTNTEFAMPPATAGAVQYYRLRAINSNGVASAYSSKVPVTRTAWEGDSDPSGSLPGTGRDN